MLMIALQVLAQQWLADRLPSVPQGSAVWADSTQAAELVSGGLAAYVSTGTTQPPPEPPYTVNQVPGFAQGTSNASH